MKKVLLTSLFVVFSLTLLFSCKKTNKPCSIAWGLELSNEITAISTASLAYSSDDSTENCNSLKAAYQDYIDALETYGNCETLTGQSRDSWKQSLDEAKDDLTTLC